MAERYLGTPRMFTLLRSGIANGGSGDWYFSLGRPMLLRGYLSAAGGTATVNVYGRNGGSGSPQRLLVTFTLSGASDEATPYYLDEPWEEVKAELVSPTGGAVATCEMSA